MRLTSQTQATCSCVNPKLKAKASSRQLVDPPFCNVSKLLLLLLLELLLLLLFADITLAAVPPVGLYGGVCRLLMLVVDDKS